VDDITGPDRAALALPEDLYLRGLVLVALGLLFVAFAQKVFTRLEASFAEQL
jgi:hypothetical protein